MNYEQAQKMYENSRKRKLTNNTYLEKNDDGSYAIRLHKTQIIKLYPGKTVLNSGGYRTVTTKARLNEFTMFDVIQNKGIWYVRKNWMDDAVVVFADGITYENGEWTGQGENPDKMRELRKQAKQYAKDYTKALFAGDVPKPNAGDCFYCSMIVQPPSIDAGRSLGEVAGGGDHIVSHIEEKYYVPSLLVNAIRVFPVSIAAKDCIARLWDGETPWEFFADAGRRQIESAIRRHCFRLLGTAG